MSWEAGDTLPLPVQVAGTKRRRRRRLVIALAIVLVVVVLLVVAAIVGERIFRSTAEKQIGQTIQTQLPKGLSGKVDAKILGSGSVILQWLHGSFDEVSLSTRDLKVDGGDASATILVQKLPTSGTGTIPSASGTLTISQAAVDAIAPLAGQDVGKPVLGDGTISTSVVRKVLGIPITVDVTLATSLQGQHIHLDPTDARLKSGFIDLPGTTLLHLLLPNGISVCAAQYLPIGVTLDQLTVTKGDATLDLSAKDLDLAAAQSGKTGHC